MLSFVWTGPRCIQKYSSDTSNFMNDWNTSIFILTNFPIISESGFSKHINALQTLIFNQVSSGKPWVLKILGFFVSYSLPPATPSNATKALIGKGEEWYAWFGGWLGERLNGGEGRVRQISMLGSNEVIFLPNKETYTCKNQWRKFKSWSWQWNTLKAYHCLETFP